MNSRDAIRSAGFLAFACLAAAKAAADDIVFQGSESFEGNTYAALSGLDSDKDPLWIASDNPALRGEIVAYGEGNLASQKPRNDYFGESPNTKYLAIDTGPRTNLVRKIASDCRPIESGIFIDMYVRFAAQEACRKIELFPKEKIVLTLVRDSSSTKLFVTAGFISSKAVYADPKYYAIDNLEINENEWYRLTIEALKSFGGRDKIGFRIYIDGEKLVSQEAKTDIDGFEVAGDIFPSLVQTGARKTNIYDLAFRGRGDVDDIVFTRTHPFGVAEISFDGGNFSIEETKVESLKALFDVPDLTQSIAGREYSYAEAYALGLVDEDSGQIEELGAPQIYIAQDGSITVDEIAFPEGKYKIEQTLQSKTRLDGEWSDIESPGKITESDTKFFRLLITIKDK